MKFKKLVCLVLITVIGCMMLSGCGNNNASKDKYGIITSSDAQAEQIKKKMKVEDKKEVADMTFYLGTMKDLKDTISIRIVPGTPIIDPSAFFILCLAIKCLDSG